MTIRPGIRISLGLIYCFLFSSSMANERILIKDFWVNEAPPGMKVLAAYGLLENKGDSDITLDKIHSPDFESIEIHETIIDNNIAQMVKKDVLLIERDGSVQFQQGGLHLMLIKPDKRKKAGDEITLRFRFSNGTEKTIQAPVKRSTGKEHHHHHNH